jgi:HEAT repeat protein
VKTKNAFPVLQEAAGMDSPDDRIRIAALQAMGPLADPQAVPILMKWASTGRPLNVRQTAIQGLGSLDRGNKEVTRALIGYLQQPYLGVRFATIFALGQRGDAEAAGPLTTLLETGEVPEILRSIVQAQVNRLRAAGQRAAQPAGGAGQPAAAQPPEAPAQTQAPAAGGDTASLQQMGAQILQMLEKLQKETADINERLKKLEARMPEKK